MLIQCFAVSNKLDHTQCRLNRRLYLLVVETLQSDYRHRPNAATLARFAMDMAAAINPAALENWSGESIQWDDLDDAVSQRGLEQVEHPVLEWPLFSIADESETQHREGRVS